MASSAQQQRSAEQHAKQQFCDELLHDVSKAHKNRAVCLTLAVSVAGHTSVAVEHNLAEESPAGDNPAVGIVAGNLAEHSPGCR